MFQISEQTWWEELDGIVIFYRTLIRLRLGHHGDSVAKAATKLLELLADFTHALLVLSGIAIVIAIVIEDVQLRNFALCAIVVSGQELLDFAKAVITVGVHSTDLIAEFLIPIEDPYYKFQERYADTNLAIF